ncbi:unnamed protein product [Rhizophagus irregularis]|nr:unnamed protein product [Rhizophagus irregularis]
MLDYIILLPITRWSQEGIVVAAYIKISEDHFCKRDNASFSFWGIGMALMFSFVKFFLEFFVEDSAITSSNCCTCVDTSISLVNSVDLNYATYSWIVLPM